MRKSPYKELRFIVEYQFPFPGSRFEPIAAFNVESVAQDYAAAGRKKNPKGSYHVVVRRDSGALEILEWPRVR